MPIASAEEGGRRIATAAAVFGSVSVGFVPALATALLRDGFAVPSLLFWRYAIGLALMLPLLPLALGRPRRPIEPRWALKVAALAAVFSTTQTWLYFNALLILPTGVVSLVFYTFPAVTAVFEFLLTGRPPGRVTLVAMAAVLVGAALAASGAVGHGGVTVAALLQAVPIPILYSVYLAGSARLLRGHSPLLGAAFLYSGLAASYSLLAGMGGLHWPAGGEAWLRLIALATLGGVLYTTLFSYGVPRLGASRYGVISSLELATVVLVGWLLLGEPLSLAQALGAALVMAGVILQSLERR